MSRNQSAVIPLGELPDYMDPIYAFYNPETEIIYAFSRFKCFKYNSKTNSEKETIPNIPAEVTDACEEFSEYSMFYYNDNYIVLLFAKNNVNDSIFLFNMKNDQWTEKKHSKKEPAVYYGHDVKIIKDKKNTFHIIGGYKNEDKHYKIHGKDLKSLIDDNKEIDIYDPEVETLPDEISFHGVALDYRTGEPVVFGGTNGLNQYYDRIYKYNSKKQDKRWEVKEGFLLDPLYSFGSVVTNNGVFSLLLGGVTYEKDTESLRCVDTINYLNLATYRVKPTPIELPYIMGNPAVVLTKNDDLHIFNGLSHWKISLKSIIPEYVENPYNVKNDQEKEQLTEAITTEWEFANCKDFKNPLVILIGVGVYDDEKEYEKLPGVKDDIKKMIGLFAKLTKDEKNFSHVKCINTNKKNNDLKNNNNVKKEKKEEHKEEHKNEYYLEEKEKEEEENDEYYHCELQEIQDFLDGLRDEVILSNNVNKYDGVILYYTGHGEQLDHIVSSDGLVLLVGDILGYFSPKQCPPLVDYPKILYSDACRSGTGAAPHKKKEISEYRDTFMHFSTIPDYKSYQTALAGSFFTDALFKTYTRHLFEHANKNKLTLNHLSLLINHYVRQNHSSQVSEIVNRLDYDLIFNLK